MESVKRTNQQYSWQFHVDCVQLKKTSAPAINPFFFSTPDWLRNNSVNSDPITKHLFVAGMKRGKTHAPAITLYFFSLLIG